MRICVCESVCVCERGREWVCVRDRERGISKSIPPIGPKPKCIYMCL